MSRVAIGLFRADDDIRVSQVPRYNLPKGKSTMNKRNEGRSYTSSKKFCIRVPIFEVELPEKFSAALQCRLGVADYPAA